ncbi:hypothetical protein KM043_016280 [Ampulex compressa]|nr:hypothetical protein KM043_016280 [Ampulex compressa]
MAQQDAINLIYTLLLGSIVVSLGVCTRYAYVYEEYGLGNEKICHPLGRKRSLNIVDKPAIVKPNRIFDTWFVTSDVHCKYVFKASRGHGLFGVIQKMSFRRNGSDCIDYVQFKRKDDHQTEKFCGTMDHSKMTYYVVPEPKNDMQNSGHLLEMSRNVYAEFDPSTRSSGGELQTEIFISKERLQEGQSLDLIIVYTPYRNCTDVKSDQYRFIMHNTCMRKEFFCDGIYNCVPGVCTDEVDCAPEETVITDIVSSGTGTKVTVGAVTTMILCFIIFVMCLWICKRSQKLCWSLDCAGPNVCSTRPGVLPHESEDSPNPTVPTAPMLEVAVTPSVVDKDLPPSYDSLFPQPSNPPRS